MTRPMFVCVCAQPCLRSRTEKYWKSARVQYKHCFPHHQTPGSVQELITVLLEHRVSPLHLGQFCAKGLRACRDVNVSNFSGRISPYR